MAPAAVSVAPSPTETSVDKNVSPMHDDSAADAQPKSTALDLEELENQTLNILQKYGSPSAKSRWDTRKSFINRRITDKTVGTPIGGYLRASLFSMNGQSGPQERFQKRNY